MNNEYKLKKEGYKTLLTSKFMELLVTISRIYRLNSDENEKKILPLKFGEVITWIEKISDRSYRWRNFQKKRVIRKGIF